MSEPERKIGVSIDPLASMGFEQRLHQGCRSLGFEHSRAASVANNGMVAFYNPVGSLVLAVFESFNVFTVAVGDANIRLTSSPQAQIGAVGFPGLPHDTRIIAKQAGYPAFTSAGLTALEYRQGDSAILTGTTGVLAGGTPATNVPALIISLPRPVVLHPGWGLLAVGPLNTAVRFNATWYERQVDSSSELQP